MNVLRTLTIIWAAILASSVLFAALHFLLPPPPPHALVSPMPMVLGVVAAGIAVASFLIPRQQMRLLIEAAAIPVTEEPDPDAQADYRARQPLRRAVRVDDALLTKIATRYTTQVILSIALSESISLFGVVLERLAFPMSLCAPFFVAGTLLIAVRRPTKRAAFAAVERVLGVAVVDAG